MLCSFAKDEEENDLKAVSKLESENSRHTERKDIIGDLIEKQQVSGSVHSNWARIGP